MFAQVFCSLFILLIHAVAHSAADEPRSAPRQATHFRLVLESDPLLSQWRERTGLFVGRADRGDCELNPFPQTPGPAWWAKEYRPYQLKVGKALSAQNDTLALIAWIADRPEPEVYVFAPTKEKCVAGTDALRGEAGASFLRKGPGVLHSKQSATLITQLTQRYGQRLSFSDAMAKQIVDGFNIDCQSADGRVLPLTNLLLARLARYQSERLWILVRAERRGDEVRIYDVTMTPAGATGEQMVFEINRWGELRPFGGLRMEAVIQACYGSFGPIWAARR